uniref:Uncharacterized protein n=1 Tax=Anguilla anguilla TaxID=7936 RepID=A0A0E9VWY7_ANGAN
MAWPPSCTGRCSSAAFTQCWPDQKNSPAVFVSPPVDLLVAPTREACAIVLRQPGY